MRTSEPSLACSTTMRLRRPCGRSHRHGPDPAGRRHPPDESLPTRAESPFGTSTSSGALTPCPVRRRELEVEALERSQHPSTRNSVTRSRAAAAIASAESSSQSNSWIRARQLPRVPGLAQKPSRWSRTTSGIPPTSWRRLAGRPPSPRSPPHPGPLGTTAGRKRRRATNGERGLLIQADRQSTPGPPRLAAPHAPGSSAAPAREVADHGQREARYHGRGASSRARKQHHQALPPPVVADEHESVHPDGRPWQRIRGRPPAARTETGPPPSDRDQSCRGNPVRLPTATLGELRVAHDDRCGAHDPPLPHEAPHQAPVRPHGLSGDHAAAAAKPSPTRSHSPAPTRAPR